MASPKSQPKLFAPASTFLTMYCWTAGAEKGVSSESHQDQMQKDLVPDPTLLHLGTVISWVTTASHTVHSLLLLPLSSLPAPLFLFLLLLFLILPFLSSLPLYYLSLFRQGENPTEFIIFSISHLSVSSYINLPLSHFLCLIQWLTDINPNPGFRRTSLLIKFRYSVFSGNLFCFFFETSLIFIIFISTHNKLIPVLITSHFWAGPLTCLSAIKVTLFPSSDTDSM